MKKLMKIFLAAVLISSLSTPAFTFQFDQKGIVKETKTSGGTSFVHFNGITYVICTEGEYQLTFSEYDTERVRLDIMPCYMAQDQYDPLSVQWSSFEPVLIELDSEDGETYLLGTETGYAEK